MSGKKTRANRTAIETKSPPSDGAMGYLSPGPDCRWRALLLSFVLLVLILLVYAPVMHYDFVTWDDPQYVYENPHVTHGLTKDDVLWAFTTGHAGYWVPLIWLSHMLDVQLFGMNAGLHHVTNVLLHAANTILLFGLFHRITGSSGRSAFVAGLFGVHPLHVESVAWVTERKDVLSTLFGLLALWAYVGYTAHRRVSRYLLVLLLFTLALMAKPMWVTLPFMLLLLDVWPLGRATLGAGPPEIASLWNQRSVWLRLQWEKLPMLALAAVSSNATFFLQRQYGAVNGLAEFTLGLRLSNVVVEYVMYIRDMLWPTGLAGFYPYPRSIPGWFAVGSFLALIGSSIMIIRSFRRCTYLAIGWLWYLGTLIPVIGLVQSGGQARADRFTYIPLIGLFVMIAWGIPDALIRWRHRRTVLPVAAALAILSCAIVARAQVRTWENSLTLWGRALEVTAGNYRAHGLLGQALAQRDRLDEAISHYSEAIRIRPDFAEVHNRLGNAFFDQGKLDEAIVQFSEALRADSKFSQAHNNWANALARQGKLDEAVAHYGEAIRITPDYADAHNGLGAVLADQGKLKDAIFQYSEALRIDPRSAQAHNNLGTALAEQGSNDQAIHEFLESLRIKPDANVHCNVGVIFLRQGKPQEATQHFETALQLNPKHQNARLGLAQLTGRGSKSP
jgi:tetratricopeptide (TPR) repeat protein